MIRTKPKMAFIYEKDDYRSQMIEYIKKNWGAMLGDDISILDEPQGLEKFQAKYFSATSKAVNKAA